MPYRTKEEQREYQRQWMIKRRSEWFRENGPCIRCGSWQDLEVDHIDPSTKELHTSALWSMSPLNPKRIKELAKCQVLCHNCHLEKTKKEHSVRWSGENALDAILTWVEVRE